MDPQPVDQYDYSKNSDFHEQATNTNPNDPNNPFPWSTTLHDIEVELFTHRTGPNLDLFDLDCSANPIDFFNLYNCFAQFHENVFNS